MNALSPADHKQFAESLPALVDAISQKHGLTRSIIMGKSRIARAVTCRAEIFRALREQGWSYPQIGIAFDRDHSSVQYALKGRAGRVAKPVAETEEARRLKRNEYMRNYMRERYQRLRAAKTAAKPAVQAKTVTQADIAAWWKARGF